MRLRLTILYGVLFLGSGAILLAITYLLVQSAFSGPLVTVGSSPHETSGGIVHAPPHTLLQQQQSADLHQLLAQSSIALAIMTAFALALGWFVAGRVLRPIRTMTSAARDISERSLHERLALDGPEDELKHLGDTIDGLLARLETAFESQRQFVANASHELRTPLMVTQTTVQVALADKFASLGSLRSACESVVATGKEQERLIDALLTLARSQRGLDHVERFDLADLARGTLTDAHEAANTAGLRLEAALEPAPTLGDSRLARTLISNLVDNAIRYNHSGGCVEVLTTPRPNHVLVRITNTGPVVPEEQLGRLLEPFQRADDQRTNHRDGLGLGLSIVAAIAVAHDAAFAIHARPGGGLAIEVAFPNVPHSKDGN